MKKSNKKIKLTLIKSISGRRKKHVSTVRGLGLRRLHRSVEIEDNPCVRGMIDKVRYLLKVEE